MREAARRHHSRVIKEYSGPQTGSYFWLPTPDGKWVLDTYFDSELPNTMHSDMWWKYAIDRLGHYWKKDTDVLRKKIGKEYTAVPRGRIVYYNGVYKLFHGNDIPTGAGGTKKILGAFNLYSLWREGKVQIMEDEHETMLPGDPEKLQRILGRDLGLRGKEPQLDWEDDEPEPSWEDD